MPVACTWAKGSRCSQADRPGEKKGKKHMANIEVTMRHSDVKIEALKEYAQQRMEKLAAFFPKAQKVQIVIDVDVKKHVYMAEVIVHRLGAVAVGAKEFSASGKSVVDAAAARAERQLRRLRTGYRKERVREARKDSPRN